MYNACICSFEAITNDQQTKIKEDMPDNTLSFIHSGNVNVGKMYTYLDNILAGHRLVTDYLYQHMHEEDLLYFYKLYLLNIAKQQLEFDIPFDYIIFISSFGQFDSIKIPQYIDTNTIYGRVQYNKIEYNKKAIVVDRRKFITDTTTFSIISTFFKFLKKTDPSFLGPTGRTLTADNIFLSCLTMNNTTIDNGVNI